MPPIATKCHKAKWRDARTYRVALRRCHKHRRYYTQDNHSPPARYEICEPCIDADGSEKNHQQPVARREVEFNFEIENNVDQRNGGARNKPSAHWLGNTEISQNFTRCVIITPTK